MNVTPGETRIAKIDSGVLTELSIERDSDLQVAGNIYLGKITRVLPGMQAAFVDIGLEKAAFLYVADIVPDLFEGLEDDEDDDVASDDGDNESSNSSAQKFSREDGRSRHTLKPENQTDEPVHDTTNLPSDLPEERTNDNTDKTENLMSEDSLQETDEQTQEDTDNAVLMTDNEDSNPDEISEIIEDVQDDLDMNAPDQQPEEEAKEDENQSTDLSATDTDQTTPTAEKSEESDSLRPRQSQYSQRKSQYRTAKRYQGKKKFSYDNQQNQGSAAPSEAPPANTSSSSHSQNQQRRPQSQKRQFRKPLPKIENLVKEGETIVVQIAKEPIHTKGARITSHISLPGRYLVYMPTVNHVGVSRRIASFQERQRLKTFLYDNKPASGGFIARTISSGVSEEKLKEDLQNLVEIWQKIYEKKEKVSPPSLLHADLNLVMKAVRDNLSKDVDRLVIDSPEDYKEIYDFTNRYMPEFSSRIELYDKETPLFDVYGIETEINRALSKKVWLKSGGYLIIDQAEALTAIDVNTGKFVGKKDFEETILTTNLEAIDEICYQLKLRSIGGIVILDLIDMAKYSHRMKVYNALKEALKKDRVKTTISKISDLGLVEMTRKRTRESLTQMLSETCFYCNGTGYVKTPLTVAFEIVREIKRIFTSITARSILVVAHPLVAKVLFNEGRERLEQIEKRIGKRIVVEPSDKFHVSHFEIRGRQMGK